MQEGSALTPCSCCNAAVHLGAIGQTLVRNVKYEVPFYQQQAAKQQQQLMDLEKRQADLLRQAASSAASYRLVISQIAQGHLCVFMSVLGVETLRRIQRWMQQPTESVCHHNIAS